MRFSEHLRSLRGSLTQSAFCRKLGIPLTTYQRYEKGERVPDIDVLVQVVKAVGISADTLLGLPPRQGTEEYTHMNSGASSHSLMDMKDIIIVQQNETIEAMAHTIKSLR